MEMIMLASQMSMMIASISGSDIGSDYDDYHSGEGVLETEEGKRVWEGTEGCQEERTVLEEDMREE